MALYSGGRGRKFESSHPDQSNQKLTALSTRWRDREYHHEYQPSWFLGRQIVLGKCPATGTSADRRPQFINYWTAEHYLGSAVKPRRPYGSKLGCRTVTCCFQKNTVRAPVASSARQCSTTHNLITQNSRKFITDLSQVWIIASGVYRFFAMIQFSSQSKY